MTDDPGQSADAASEGYDQARFDQVLRDLDALPAELVKQAIQRRGLSDVALDTLRDLARQTENLETREKARTYIHEAKLGLILGDEEDPPAAP